jgi:hypothetical protein
MPSEETTAAPPQSGDEAERTPGALDGSHIVDRRRPGRAEYKNQHLIALLRNEPISSSPGLSDIRNDVSSYTEDDADDLRPAKGIVMGVLLGLALWLIIGSLVWVLI